MISSQGTMNTNAIRYSSSKFKQQQPVIQDSQLNQFEDNYVFKTLPSFQLSESQTKIQKSDKWFKTKQDTNFRMMEEKSTCIQRKKRSNKKIQSTQQQEKLLVTQLKAELNRVEDERQMKNIENEKLKRYIEFLQEYNLKLKKELVVVMRRRTIDDEIIMDGGIGQGLVSGVRADVHSVQCKCTGMNQTNTIKNYVKPHNSLYPASAYTTKYVTHFHQLPEKQTPYYWPSQHQKINKNKKKLPVSLQASLIGRKNLLLQSSSLNTNYTHIDTSVPTIQNVHTPQTQDYLITQNHKVPQSYANDSTSAKVNDFICSKCFQTEKNPKKQKQLSKRNTNTKNRKSMSTSKDQKRNKVSQFICQVHNKESKTNNSTLPTRQRTIEHSPRQKQKQCKNTQNRNSSKRKPLRHGQKVTISEFCI